VRVFPAVPSCHPGPGKIPASEQGAIDVVRMIENKTFDDITIGDSASMTRALHPNDVAMLAAVTGNVNLMTLDETADGKSMFVRGSGHAAWAATLFSTLAGTKLPGIGSITKAFEIHFERPIPYGVTVTATVEVTEKRAGDGTVVLSCRCCDDEGTVFASGSAEVIAPTTKIRQRMAELPKVQLRREDRYLELIRACEGLPPLTTAIVHPCSDDSLAAAIQAAEQLLINPILVGPRKKIEAIADAEDIDISPYRIEPAEHSHHAAEKAVALVRAGEADAMMKGSLHTDELLGAVMQRTTGLRTERRISHCFLLSVPTYQRPIIITDAAINIYPSLVEKRDICQNAIDLAHALGMNAPKVAILAAVEKVTPSMPSTLDAAALCKMAERGQIKGALLDGPLAFDNAVDEEAAHTKGIVSAVAGRADILVVPDLEAGNMLAKQLTFMADAEAAGILLGARVPIILTSRADSIQTRLASCAVAVLVAHATRERLSAKAAE
jgi:phosphate acetyltransferase